MLVLVNNVITAYIREKAFREMKKRCRDDHCTKK